MKLKPSKKTLLYTAYIIGITIFFLWYLFPSDILTDYLAYRLGQLNADVVVDVDRISPVLPPGIKLHEVYVSHRDMALFEVESLKIMPGLGSLFSDTTAIDFNGRLYEGSFSGRAEISSDSNSRGIRVDGHFSNIQVQQVSALQQLSDHEVSGGLGGKFVYSDEKKNRKLSGNLNMTNCRVDLAAAIFKQKSFEFKNIDTDLALQNKTLVINGFKATGNQMDLNIVGRVKLNHIDPVKNELNLSGTVTPHHVFMAKIEKDLPAGILSKKSSGQRAVQFKIEGTLEDPGFSLN